MDLATPLAGALGPGGQVRGSVWRHYTSASYRSSVRVSCCRRVSWVGLSGKPSNVIDKSMPLKSCTCFQTHPRSGRSRVTAQATPSSRIFGIAMIAEDPQEPWRASLTCNADGRKFRQYYLQETCLSHSLVVEAWPTAGVEAHIADGLPCCPGDGWVSLSDPTCFANPTRTPGLRCFRDRGMPPCAVFRGVPPAPFADSSLPVFNQKLGRRRSHCGRHLSAACPSEQAIASSLRARAEGFRAAPSPDLTLSRTFSLRRFDF